MQGGNNCTHITTMVCVSGAGTTVTPALLLTEKTVFGRLFSKEACSMFIKATQGDSKKGGVKAASSSDTKAQDRKKKQKETKGRWSDAVTFMECVREVFVAEIRPKHNEYGCVVFIVDGSKTCITQPI